MKKIMATLIFCFISLAVFSQTPPRIGSFQNDLKMINPALTGVKKNPKVHLLYKKNGNFFKSRYALGSFENAVPALKGSIGASYSLESNDFINDSFFKIFYAYSLSLGDQKSLAFGSSITYLRQSFTNSLIDRLRTTPTLQNPNSFIVFNEEPVSNIDADLGINYVSGDSFIGISLQNIFGSEIRSSEFFFSGDNIQTVNIVGGTSLKVSNSVKLNPSFFYSMSYNMGNFGNFSWYALQVNSVIKSKFIIGASYSEKFERVIAGNFGIIFKERLQLIGRVEIDTDRFISSNDGGEISLIYTFKNK